MVGRAVRTSDYAGHGIYWRVVCRQHHLRACRLFGKCGALCADCGLHVQRVLAGSDGKVEDDTVTLSDERGEISCVVERRDVEHVTAIHEGPDRCEICWRNARDKLRMETEVRVIVAKDAVSAMVKLMTGIEESTFDDVDYGGGFPPMTLPNDKLRSASFLSRPADRRMQVDDARVRLKSRRSMSSITAWCPILRCLPVTSCGEQCSLFLSLSQLSAGVSFIILETPSRTGGRSRTSMFVGHESVGQCVSEQGLHWVCGSGTERKTRIRRQSHQPRRLST